MTGRCDYHIHRDVFFVWLSISPNNINVHENATRVWLEPTTSVTMCRGFPKLGSKLVRSYLPYFVVHTTLVMSDSWIDVCSTAINLIITALLLYLQLWQSKRYASYTRKLSLRRTDEDYRKPMAGLADQRPKRLHRIKSDYLNTAIAWTIIRSQVTFRIGLTLRVQLLKISKKYL